MEDRHAIAMRSPLPAESNVAGILGLLPVCSVQAGERSRPGANLRKTCRSGLGDDSRAVAWSPVGCLQR
jgi:hypothetical protein